jgi:hypothetical protein
MASASVISWCNYGWETAFGSATTTVDKTFGHGLRITSLNRKNNIERVYSAGFRNSQKLVPKKYEGSVSLEFVLSNPWFFRAVMGTISSTGSAPYTHTFAESDTIPSLTIDNDISSDTPSVARITGAKVANCTITSAVGELVRVKLDMMFANETHATTTASVVAETHEVFSFSHGTLELPDGSTLALVQNVELSITNNPEYVWGQGSRFAQAGPVKNREYGIKATLAYQQVGDLLSKLYGGTTGPATMPAETATMVLTFDNGSTGTAQRNVILSVTGIQLDDHNLPQDPTQLILEDASMFGRSLSVTSLNNTQTSP